MNRGIITRWHLARYLLGAPFYMMLALITIEAALAACTTWLVINAGRNVANDQFLIWDLLWIFVAQSSSYVVGTISWIFAERAGCRAFGQYMFRFARENRTQVRLFNDKPTREQVEPFLTGESYHSFFNLMYEMEFVLKLLLALVFNSIVLGAEIDGSLPVAYAAVFGALLGMQWLLQKPVARAYLENQRMTNRVTAHGYTAWDNIFGGNAYNLHLWSRTFKERLRDSLRAQIKAILTREGLSAASGVIGLAVVFGTMIYVASRNSDNTELLIALATTLPRQIEMTYEVHLLATGWNELLAVWTRLGGVAKHILLQPDPNFDDRIKFERLTLREDDDAKSCSSVQEALDLVMARPNGRINVRGSNGSGKSTLLTALKSEIKNRAYYWPTSDRLAFRFAEGAVPESVERQVEEDEDEEVGADMGDAVPAPKKLGFSSGERQIRSLQEIVAHTDASIYLLDEWDANLDAHNRAAADALVEELSRRARVVEISHRDRAVETD
jgi:ABC-type bacteriocin/lantibiotic exporter with double-glycine peptidase domain